MPYPHTAAVAHELSGGDQGLYQQLHDYALSCATPAYDYFQLKFYNDLKLPLDTFKTARFFNPTGVCELKPTSIHIEDLKVFPFLTLSVQNNLKAELPMHLSKVEGVPTEVLKSQWW